MLTLAVVLLVALAVIRLRFRFTREHRDRYGPRLYQRFSNALAAYEGEAVPPEVLSRLESRLNELFFDALTGAGLVPSGWRVQVVLDDVLGPVAQIHGQNGEVLSVAEFEQRVRDGRLELAVGASRPKRGAAYRSSSL